MPVTELFYMTQFFWLILLLSVPVITMRLFALEKFSGTFETLMTTPVTRPAGGAAKFTAALIFYMFMWLPLLGCILILRHFTSEPGIRSGRGRQHLSGNLPAGLPVYVPGLLRLGPDPEPGYGGHDQPGLKRRSFHAEFSGQEHSRQRLGLAGTGLFGLPEQMHDFVRGVVDTRPVVLCVTRNLLLSIPYPAGH